MNRAKWLLVAAMVAALCAVPLLGASFSRVVWDHYFPDPDFGICLMEVPRDAYGRVFVKIWYHDEDGNLVMSQGDEVLQRMVLREVAQRR